MPPVDDLFRTGEGDELARAIAGLYGAFADCALDDNFAGCSHCFTDHDILYLRRTPLRDLTSHDASFILGKAISTLGSAKDFNYFLPRILEAWAYHQHYMEHLIPEKLALARQAGWTQAQERNVGYFVRAMYKAAKALPDDWPFREELSGMEDALQRQFPEIAKDIHVELRA